MYDTNSMAFLGIVLILVSLIIAIILYFVLKKFINKHLSLTIVLMAFGYFWRDLDPYNYPFYLAALIFFLLFLFHLFTRRKNHR